MTLIMRKMMVSMILLKGDAIDDDDDDDDVDDIRVP